MYLLFLIISKRYKRILISYFKELQIDDKFKENLQSLNLEKMTEIQSLCIEKIFDNKDLIAQAKTGSGKTLAFCLPLVKKLDSKKYRIQALILAPTRELANQISNELRKLTRHIPNIKVLSLCGGTPFKPQVESINHGAHFVVGTPGRILQHIHETKIDFKDVETFVLDEADKMLDMGFYDDIIKIEKSLKKQRQSLLFSATFQGNIKTLSNEVLNKPLFVKASEIVDNTHIKQTFYEIEEESKTSFIPTLISSNKASSVLIFCNTKIKCEELADSLFNIGLDVLTIHSNLDQKQRDETLILFSNKSYPILIATDLASRGLDINDIDLVINFDLAKDEDIHTHRIGRTARAGKDGLAVSLFDSYEKTKVEDITDRFSNIVFDDIQNLHDDISYEIDAPFRTIYINAGKKNKLRAGDILGSLTAGLGLKKEQIGKIDILNFSSYVAVEKSVFKKALNGLAKGKIKGRKFKVFEK